MDYRKRKKVMMMTKHIDKYLSKLYEKLIAHSRDNLFEDLQLYFNNNGTRDYETFGSEIDAITTYILDLINDCLIKERVHP